MDPELGEEKVGGTSTPRDDAGGSSPVASTCVPGVG